MDRDRTLSVSPVPAASTAGRDRVVVTGSPFKGRADRRPEVADLSAPRGRAGRGWQREAAEVGGSATAVALDRTVRWTAAVWDLIWLVGIAVSLTAQVDSLRLPWVSWALLAVATAAWVLGPMSTLLPVRWFVALTALTAIGQVLNTDPQALQGEYLAAIVWLNLAGIMGAYLLRQGRGPLHVLSLSVVAEAFILLMAIRDGMLVDVWRGCLMLAWYAVGNGMAVAMAIIATDNLAGAEDEAAEQEARAQVVAEAARAHRDESFNVSRLLHDTAVNTLGAIAVGVSASRSAVISLRCASDLAALRTACSNLDRATDAGVVDLPNGVLTAARDRARVLGLRLHEQVDLAAFDSPVEVLEALSACVDEALLNVAKHAGVEQAQLVVQRGRGGVSVTIRDHGRGFEDPGRGEGGIAQSIIARARAAGIDAAVTSRPGDGTSVELTWSPPTRVGSPTAKEFANPIMNVLPGGGARIAVWLTLLALVATLLAADRVPVAWTSVAVAVAVACATMLIYLSRRLGVIPDWACGVAVAAEAFTAFVPGWGGLGCDRVGTAWWGGDAGLLVLIVMGLLIDRIAWVVVAGIVHVAAVAILLSQTAQCAGQTIVVTVINIGVLVGPVVIRHLGRRFGAQATQYQRAAAQAWARTATLRAQERVRDVRARAAMSAAGPLLAGIAEGQLDPTDTDVRRRCGDVERYLRSTMRVDPDLGELGDVIVRAVDAAYSRGISVVVRSAEATSLPGEAAVREIAAILDGVVARCPADDRPVISLFPCDQGGGMTIVLAGATAVNGDAADSSASPYESALRVSEVSIGDQTLIELSWAGAPQA